MDSRPLSVAEALAIVARWRRDPGLPVECPLCAMAAVTVADHSARPHAEWYRIACPACGLDQNLHIPSGAPAHGLD